MKDIAVALIAIVVLALVFMFLPGEEKTELQLKKFSSEAELKNYLKASSEAGMYYGYDIVGGARVGIESLTEGMAVPKAGEAQAGGTDDYSTTNIQVAGVDEADILKNDGRYIYNIVNNKVVIVDAYPAENAEILSEIKFNNSPSQIFINGGKLVVFGGGYTYIKGGIMEEVEAVVEKAVVGEAVAEEMIARYPYYSGKTFMNIYDVSDRSNPVLIKNFTLDGNYYNSRMIGDYVYLITNQQVYDFENPVIPFVARCGIGCIDVWYFDVPESSHQFTIITALNVQNPDELESEVFLTGYTQNLYVSTGNIYVTYTKRLRMTDFLDNMVNAILPLVPGDTAGKINEIMASELFSNDEKMSAVGRTLNEYSITLTAEERLNFQKSVEDKMAEVQQELAKKLEKTIIHKISVSNGNIEYKVQGEAPGNVLNQFSMDEYNGYFRVATTSSWSESKNHLYVLDDELNIVGKVEDLASGERIYSARFIGNRGYMVTFRQIDPLFVIDLENPNNPQVLGFLKITGVSDYLHPYDENHLIGVGRDATEEGRMKGMKLSLFDVSDVANPKEISKYLIGERGTSSDALNDHKAFLFSRQKNLLVIPINLVEDDWRQTWQGAYAFNLDIDNGFVLKGRVTHREETNETEKEGWYYDYSAQIRRSLYIDDVLYTVSSKMIKANSLDDMSEINKVELA